MLTRARLLAGLTCACLAFVAATGGHASAVGPDSTVVFADFSGWCTVHADDPNASEGWVTVRGIISCRVLFDDTHVDVDVCAERLTRVGFHIKWVPSCRSFTHTFLGLRNTPNSQPPDFYSDFAWDHRQEECPDDNDSVYRTYVGVTFTQTGRPTEYRFDESTPFPAPCVV